MVILVSLRGVCLEQCFHLQGNFLVLYSVQGNFVFEEEKYKEIKFPRFSLTKGLHSKR